MATASNKTMATTKITCTYGDRRKRIARCENVTEIFDRIRRQFSISDADDINLKARIGGIKYDIETQADVDELKEADELIVEPKQRDLKKTAQNGVGPHDSSESSDDSDIPTRRPSARPKTRPGDDEVSFTNVYVKHIQADVDDDDLKEMFAEFGAITSAKVERDKHGRSKLFGFVNFVSPRAAKDAVDNMDDKVVDDRRLYVQPHQQRSRRQKFLREQFKERYKPPGGSNLYIKNLDLNIDEERLRKEFACFGNITSIKVAREDDGKSKGFGFVSFSTPEEASDAITEMDGRIIASKPLYVAHFQSKKERQPMLAAAYRSSSQARARSLPPLFQRVPLQMPLPQGAADYPFPYTSARPQGLSQQNNASARPVEQLGNRGQQGRQELPPMPTEQLARLLLGSNFH